MKKRKGILLLMVLVIVLVVAILSIPAISMIRQNTQITYTELTKHKADEVAYAGFQAVTRYIIENKEEFMTEIQADPLHTLNYPVNIEYTENGVSKKVEVVMKNPVFEVSNLKSLDIEATTIFGGEKGFYKERVNFNVETENTTEGFILFPEDPYYLITNGITGDRADDNQNYDKKERKGLLQRLSEREIVDLEGNYYVQSTLPKIGNEEHIEWFRRNSNFFEVNLIDNENCNQDKINNWISTLEAKEKNRPLHVLYLNFANSNHTATFPGKRVKDTLNNYYYLDYTKDINMDISSLGNGVDNTDLIILTNGNMTFPVTNADVKGHSKGNIIKFNITGGNVYFLANGNLNLTKDGLSSILHEITEHEEIAPQLTFASTTGSPFTNWLNFHGNTQNTFYYFPNSDLLGNIYHNFDSPDFGKPIISGGMTLGQGYYTNPDYSDGYYSYSNQQEYEGESYNKSYYSRVKWKGKMQYFGYLIK